MNHHVSEAALVRRVNRKLARIEKRLCVLGERRHGFYNLGRFHIVDTYRNAVLDFHVDVEKLAREIGVMRSDECMT